MYPNKYYILQLLFLWYIYRVRHVGSDLISVEEKEEILRTRRDADRIYKVSDYVVAVVLFDLLE